MINTIVKFCAIFSFMFGLESAYAVISPFSFERMDGTTLEGHISPPLGNASVFVAVPQMPCSSDQIVDWYTSLCDLLSAAGYGVITLERQVNAPNEPVCIDSSYSLQSNFEDYILCVNGIQDMVPGWQGDIFYLGKF